MSNPTQQRKRPSGRSVSAPPGSSPAKRRCCTEELARRLAAAKLAAVERAADELAAELANRDKLRRHLARSVWPAILKLARKPESMTKSDWVVLDGMDRDTLQLFCIQVLASGHTTGFVPVYLNYAPSKKHDIPKTHVEVAIFAALYFKPTAAGRDWWPEYVGNDLQVAAIKLTSAVVDSEYDSDGDSGSDSEYDPNVDAQLRLTSHAAQIRYKNSDDDYWQRKEDQRN